MGTPATIEQLNKLAETLAKLNALKYTKSKSREPYYKEEHAVWFRDNILAKVQRGETVEVEITKERNMTTVACMMAQARKFLFANLDPDGEWKKVWEMTNCAREMHGRKRYRFFPHADFDNSMRVITPVTFYGELTDYLNGLAGREDGSCIFEKEGLFMADSDVEKLNGMLNQYTSLITYVVTHSMIKIINIPSE